MDRLVELYAACRPFAEVRAAWLHHAFTQIHPFQDGNGRVARALASIDFIKAGLFRWWFDGTSARCTSRRCAAPTRATSVRSCVISSISRQGLLRRAISEAEGALDTKAGLTNVLAAAARKRARRSEWATAERQLLRQRLTALLDDAQSVWLDIGEKIREQIAGIDVRPVQRADVGNRHWFGAPLLELGRRYEYWADLDEHRDWVRLQLRDGGVTDIVVAAHLIGNPSPGAGVPVAFVEHRHLDEPADSSAPMTVAAEPLLLSADEDEQAQRPRFGTWLDAARNTALAQWTKYL